MTNRRQKSLARRRERIATNDVVWKGASGSARHGISMHVSFFVLMQDLCGSNLSSGLWALPGPGQREREDRWPQAFQVQGQCKGGGTMLAHFAPEPPYFSLFYLILITLWYVRALVILFSGDIWLYYVIVGYIYIYRTDFAVMWAIVGYCGMLHCHISHIDPYRIIRCILILYVELYWCILYMFWISQGFSRWTCMSRVLYTFHSIDSFRPGDWWQIERRKA